MTSHTKLEMHDHTYTSNSVTTYTHNVCKGARTHFFVFKFALTFGLMYVSRVYATVMSVQAVPFPQLQEFVLGLGAQFLDACWCAQ